VSTKSDDVPKHFAITSTIIYLTNIYLNHTAGRLLNATIQFLVIGIILCHIQYFVVAIITIV